MRDNIENILLVVDPFGFPSAHYQQGAKEYLLCLENTLSKVDRDIIQTVLLTSPTSEFVHLHQFWEQEQAFIERGYFDDIVKYCWVYAPHAPVANDFYKQDKELPLNGKRHVYLCGALAEECVFYQAGKLKRRSKGLDLIIVYDLTFSKNIPPLQPYELRKLYSSHKVPIRTIMSRDLPFLR